MSADTAHDAEVAAERLSFDRAATVEYIRVQDAWDEVTDQIKRLVPTLYAGASRSGPSDPDPHVLFTAAPPAAVIELLETLPFDTTVDDGAPLSEDALGQLSDVAYHTVAAVPGAMILTTSSDPRTAKITILVSHATSAALLAREQDAVETAPALNGRTIELGRADEGASVQLLSHTGGGKDLDSGGSLACTSGFATGSGGYSGVSTAKHCDNYLTWDTRTGIIAFDHEASIPGDKEDEVDIQFHHDLGSNVSDPTFWATGSGSSDIRTVTSASNAKLGDYIYKYGRVGGYAGPSRVSGLNVSYDSYDATGTLHHYIGGAQLDLSTASWQHGDSGGPVFVGNTAKGSVSAALTDKDEQYGFYVPQTRWGEDMNASVLTGN